MATFSISGDNASYTLTLSGMSTSTRYHVFVADLNTNGTGSGFYCRRSAIGSSTTWTYKGSSSSPYSQYQRLVQVYTTTNPTAFNSGVKYSSTEIFNILSAAGSWDSLFSDYIPAHSGATTYYYKYRWITSGGSTLGDSSVYNASSTSGGVSVTLSNIPTYSGYIKTNSYTAIQSCTIYASSDYAWCTSTSSSSPSIIGVYVQIIPSYYYRYQWLLADGTSVAISQLMSDQSTSGGISVTLSTIPTHEGYTKTGNYTAIAHCTINAAQNNAWCNSTSESSPSVIGVYVELARITYYYQYRYIKGTTTISTSSTKSGESTSGGVSVTLSAIPTVAGYVKTGSYSAIRDCTLNLSEDYAFCTSDSSPLPSIIGVYVTDEIDPFYWFGNETTDANNIQSGKTRTMTATMWDSFADTVDTLASICGVTVSISRPSSGGRMNASQYNTAVTALTTIKNSRTAFGNVTLPSALSSGSSIAASQFQGTGSIKGALNAMIALL